MTQLQKFLFELSFGEIKKIRDYMLKNTTYIAAQWKNLNKL